VARSTRVVEECDGVMKVFLDPETSLVHLAEEHTTMLIVEIASPLIESYRTIRLSIAPPSLLVHLAEIGTGQPDALITRCFVESSRAFEVAVHDASRLVHASEIGTTQLLPRGAGDLEKCQGV